PGQEGALTPGEDYTTVVGEDLCALGESFAETLNQGVGEGKVAMLGGTPGNALSLGWQRCTMTALADSIEVVNPRRTRTRPRVTRTGSTRSSPTSSAASSPPTRTSPDTPTSTPTASSRASRPTRNSGFRSRT